MVQFSLDTTRRWCSKTTVRRKSKAAYVKKAMAAIEGPSWWCNGVQGVPERFSRGHVCVQCVCQPMNGSHTLFRSRTLQQQWGLPRGPFYNTVAITTVKQPPTGWPTTAGRRDNRATVRPTLCQTQRRTHAPLNVFCFYFIPS